MAKSSMMSEFWLFLKQEKKWWLGPILLVFLALGAVLLVANGSVIAPFIYTLF